MKRGRGVRIGAGIVIVLCLTMMSQAQLRARGFIGGGAAAGPGMVNLPYVQQDNVGNNWQIYNGGWFRQNNNMPIYGQGAMIWINGQPVQQAGNQARLDPKTGEVIVDNMTANGCSIVRHIYIDKAAGYIRFVDVIKNTQNQQQTFNLMFQSNSNYGINMGQEVADPRKKGQNLGWVGQTGANQSMVEMYAGKGAKVAPQLNYQPGNNVIQANLPLTIAAGKEMAVLHIHTVAPTQDAGMKFMTDLKESPLIKTIAAPLRRLIVNFRAGSDFIGDIEILRGDVLDVVELRSGDEYKGTIKEDGYQLQTFYGNIALPIDKVIGIINVGQFRPRQLLVTTDGQIFGGHLKKENLQLQMSSGQTIQVPLSQISRVGYRKQNDEPREWTLDKPMVVMRSGERVAVQMPANPIEVVTRYGTLSLKPEQVAAALLQNEDNTVHEIELTDGSKFAGLLTAPWFEMKLDTGGGPDQTVRFPTGAIAKIQLNTKLKEPDDATPSIKLSNEDELNGALIGNLKLDTSFDTIGVNAPELKSLAHAPEGGANDVQVTLWDGTSLSGQLEDQDVACQLVSGVTLKVPVALVREYVQPVPQPSAAMVEKIKKVVETDLSNDDWHVRDRARAQLLSMGPAVAAVLKGLRDNQPPEAQKTIDIILAELEKQRKIEKSGGLGPAPGANAGAVVEN